MKFTLINFEKDLSEIVQVLNVSHATVAKEFGFTKKIIHRITPLLMRLN